MKYISIIAAILLCAGSAGAVQQRKAKRQPAPRPAARERAPNPSAPRVVGTPIVVTTKNGDRLTGVLLDLTAYSVRMRSGALESTIALDTIASLSFGQAGEAPRREQENTAIKPEFAREFQTALNSFQSVAAELKAGTDYTEYGHLLSDLRRGIERFIERYSTTDNGTEARAVALVAGAITDYTWARTVWTMKLGRTSDGSVSEADSPALADILALYPDLREATATGNRYSADKLVAGLWRKAAEKVDRARSLTSQSR